MLPGKRRLEDGGYSSDDEVPLLRLTSSLYSIFEVTLSLQLSNVPTCSQTFDRC